MRQVAVVIPLYRSTVSPVEAFALHNNHFVLRRYPIIVIHPEGMDLSELKERYPRFSYRPFAPKHFATLQAYNSLMLSEEFYAAFTDFDYILIAQEDAYVIKDNLSQWCNKGYDYIGAPWVERSVYQRFPLNWWMRYDQQRKHRRGLRCRQDLFGHVGNGGLSLRRVQLCLKALREKQDVLLPYREIAKPFYAEDIFWALENPDFKRPSWQEALLFAFDKDPDYCYKLTGGQLPFGCHAAFKGKMRRFWYAIFQFEPFGKRSTRY